VSDPLQTLIQKVAVPEANPFPPESRYHDVAIATFRRPDGVDVAYLRRRMVPPPQRFETLVVHTVTQGERLDMLAAQYLGDPEQFWQICDANGVLRPDELTEVAGRHIRITLPNGVPGAPRA
jgi:hypothetical protein